MSAPPTPRCSIAFLLNPTEEVEVNPPSQAPPTPSLPPQPFSISTTSSTSDEEEGTVGEHENNNSNNNNNNPEGDSESEGEEETSMEMGDARTKRPPRKLMSDLQRALLEEEFVNDPFPTTLRKAQLGIQLGMPLKTVHVWFQNKRARSKKKGVKIQRKKSLKFYQVELKSEGKKCVLLQDQTLDPPRRSSTIN
jgi:hypothetical protein